MSFFVEMNKKMDEGWKMTDQSCSTCKFSLIVSPTGTLRCVKCQKDDGQLELNIPSQNQSNNQKKPECDEDESDQNEESDYGNFEYLSKSNTDQVSQKLSTKLLQGWTMLKESCEDCLIPVMKSKQGEMICVGCNTDFNKIQQQKRQEIQALQKPQAPVIVQIPQQTTVVQQQKVEIKEDKNISKPLPKELADQCEANKLLVLQMINKELTKMKEQINHSDLNISKLEQLWKLQLQIN